MMEQPFSKEQIREALERLAVHLRRRNVTGEIYVFGGTAMVLAYDARRATRDVDAVFAPHGPVHEAALAVAKELGLPRYWLNDQGSVYLAASYKDGAVPIFDDPNLRVLAVSARQLLAMKALAARLGVDSEDVAFLAQHLGLGTADEVASVVAEVFPDEMFTERARLVVEDALGSD